MKTFKIAIGIAVWMMSSLTLRGEAIEVPPEINWHTHKYMDMKDVKTGMIMYSRTRLHENKMVVFKIKVTGTGIRDRAQNKIQGVVIDNETLSFFGISSGMSGSPVYYQDMIVGAISHTFAYLKLPQLVITPIKDMLRVIEYHEKRYPTNEPYLHSGDFQDKTGMKYKPHNHASQSILNALSANEPFMMQDLLRDTFNELGWFRSFDTTGMPLVTWHYSISTKGAGDKTKKRLPIQGGFSAQNNKVHSYQLEPGDSCGVGIVRGDITLGAIGTVTYLTTNNQLLLYGHGQDRSGHVRFPFYRSHVDGVMPSFEVPNKIAYITEEIGTMVQDRITGCLALLGEKHVRANSDIWIPMTLKTRTLTNTNSYYFEMVRDRSYVLLVPPFIVGTVFIRNESRGNHCMLEAIAHIQTDYKDRRITLKRTYAGYNEASVISAFIRDYSGAAESFLYNPFRAVSIKHIEMDLHVRPLVDVYTIKEVAYDKSIHYKPGDLVKVKVTLSRYRRGETQQTLSLRLPENLSPGVYRLGIGSADAYRAMKINANKNRYHVNSLDRLIEMINEDAKHPNHLLLMWMPLPASGYMINHREYKDLPYYQREMLHNTITTYKLPTSTGFILGTEPVDMQIPISQNKTVFFQIVVKG